MTIKTLTPTQAHTMLAQGNAILIDVREANEFSAEHIAHAVSLPLSNLMESIQLLNLPATRPIIFQCLSGKRSGQACELMTTQGIPNPIHTIEGGITGWKNANLPVVATAAGISIFRQVQIIVGGLIAALVITGMVGGFMLAFMLAAIFGTALMVAGLTGWCGMAMLLAKMPWNR